MSKYQSSQSGDKAGSAPSLSKSDKVDPPQNVEKAANLFVDNMTKSGAVDSEYPHTKVFDQDDPQHNPSSGVIDDIETSGFCIECFSCF